MKIPTGLPELDRVLCGGLESGRLYLAAGAPRRGKTTLVLQVAMHAALGVPARAAALFSVALDRPDLVSRMLARESGFRHPQGLRGMRPGAPGWDELRAAAARLDAAPLYIDDSDDLTTAQLRRRALRLREELAGQGGLGLIVIDSLQHLRINRLHVAWGKRGMAWYMLSQLRTLAQEAEAPVLVVSRLNRSGETGERRRKGPRLEDIPRHRSVRQHADTAFVFWRPEEGVESVLSPRTRPELLRICRLSTGETEDISVWVDGGRCRIHDRRPEEDACPESGRDW